MFYSDEPVRPPDRVAVRCDLRGNADIFVNGRLIMQLTIEGSLIRYRLSQEDVKMGIRPDENGRIFLEN